MKKSILIHALLNFKGWGPSKVYSYVYKHSFDYDNCFNALLLEINDADKQEFKNQYSKSKEIIIDNLKKGIKVISILDESYPQKLYTSSEKCVLLFYRGDVSLLNMPIIAIIGTRKPTEEFIDKGKIVTNYYSKKGYTILSGLALGCDSVAHNSCIESGGKTIAVLPSPCDNPQPTSNRGLAEKIVETGGLLISEYSSGSAVNKFNYPKRDKIQSLLSDVIIIIQASNESGTMIAVKKSIKDGKFVCAIKGNDIDIVDNYVNVNSQKELDLIEVLMKNN